MLIYPRRCNLCRALYKHRSSFSQHFSRGVCERTSAKNAIVLEQQQEKKVKSVSPHASTLPAGGIYMIQTGMCFALDNNVYKVGATGAGFTKRFNQYEKGGKEICFQLCDDYQSKESQLLGLFRNQFTQRKDFGTEFFEGDIVAMIETFNRFLLVNSK